LNVTRAELLEYAREHDLSWCEDESNTDVKFARNSIRHQLLPHLEKEVPGATKQLCKIATLADKAYESVMRKCENMFGAALCTDIEERRFPNKSGMTSFIALDKKKLNKILVVHKEADFSEMFRLWLSEKGFRFPIGFFYSNKEPAHIKIPTHCVYRKRSIVKIRHTVWFCEFKDALSAAKFVSCEMKEKDYNEST
jgi:tRNA(Ile)-lysidine synthase